MNKNDYSSTESFFFLKRTIILVRTLMDGHFIQDAERLMNGRGQDVGWTLSRLNCLDCENFYVGQSIRHVCKRKEEHMGDLNVSVYKRARGLGHRTDWDNVKIFDTAQDQRRLLLKEMLRINKLKAQLNVQKSSKLFSLIIGNNEN